jgi:hypothetical protein
VFPGSLASLRIHRRLGGHSFLITTDYQRGRWVWLPFWDWNNFPNKCRCDEAVGFHWNVSDLPVWRGQGSKRWSSVKIFVIGTGHRACITGAPKVRQRIHVSERGFRGRRVFGRKFMQRSKSWKLGAGRADYLSFAYSALASFRIGISGSASFQRVRKTW